MDKKKQDLTIYCLQKTYFSFKDTHKLKDNGWKYISHASRNKNKSRDNYTYIRKKIDFKPKTVTGDKEGHYIVIKV